MGIPADGTTVATARVWSGAAAHINVGAAESVRIASRPIERGGTESRRALAPDRSTTRDAVGWGEDTAGGAWVVRRESTTDRAGWDVGTGLSGVRTRNGASGRVDTAPASVGLIDAGRPTRLSHRAVVVARSDETASRAVAWRATSDSITTGLEPLTSGVAAVEPGRADEPVWLSPRRTADALPPLLTRDSTSGALDDTETFGAIGTRDSTGSTGATTGATSDRTSPPFSARSSVRSRPVFRPFAGDAASLGRCSLVPE